MILLMLLPFAVYGVGYMIAAQRIYHAFMRTQTANLAKVGRRMKSDDVVNSVFGASILALFWPFTVPWLLSRMLFGRGSRRLVVEEEIERYRDDHADQERRRRQLQVGRAEAREIEIETEITGRSVRRPDPTF